MELVHEIVRALAKNSDLFPKDTIISPIYNLKTVDVKRNSFLLVYDLRRDIYVSGIGGFGYYEDATIVFDIRSYYYEDYDVIKRMLKSVISSWERRGELGENIFVIFPIYEVELSNKARGLYRFVLRVLVKRMLNPTKYYLMFKEEFEGGNSVYNFSGGTIVKDGYSWVLQNNTGGSVYANLNFKIYDRKGFKLYGKGVWIDINDKKYGFDKNGDFYADGEKIDSGEFFIKIEDGNVYVDNTLYSELSNISEIRIEVEDGGELKGYEIYKRWL